MKALAIDDIDVDTFAVADVERVLDYWYRSPKSYLLSMGVDQTALPKESLMREMLLLNIGRRDEKAGGPETILTIKVRNVSVGVHELTHLTAPTSAIMHAHIWDAGYRGLGIGMVSYVKALRRFFDRCGLEQILFATPAHNLAARRVKERLGIHPFGTGVLRWPIMTRPVETISYRVLRAEMPMLERNMREQWQIRRLERPEPLIANP